MNIVEIMVDTNKTRKKIALKTGENCSGYSYTQELSVQTSQVHITSSDVLD